jgi:signal transduction histidine kinase
VPIRVKVTILLALLFTTLIAAQWVIQQQLMLPRFVELERDSARTDMQRVVLALEREQQALGALAADWGNWKDLWRYIQDHNADFAHTSLTDNAVRTVKANYMALIALGGRFDWRHGLDHGTGKPLTIRLNGNDQLEPAWASAVAQGLPVSGLIKTNLGVMIAAGAPILDGYGHGPARGMVIMGRLLNKDELLRLGNQAQVTLDMRAWGEDPTADAMVSAALRVGDARLTASENSTRIERGFPNLSGVPLLALGIDVPRTISHRGADAVRYSTRMLGVAAFIVLAALLALLGRMVLTPLAQVTAHAQQIAAADDLSARLAYDRRDELGALARTFDHMVERLAQTRRELIDRSFESGAAENASGVLHNLGNAMTPLSINITELQQQLGTVPAGDLQLALEELRRGTPDPERRRDLQQFVQLTAADLLHSLRRSDERVRQVIAQTELIQAVIAEQRQHRRSEPVRQLMRPAELIARSIEHVAPVHRERLQVELAPGLSALGPLSLPATMLGMVLQNLAQNAAESAAHAGLPRTRLRFDANLVESSGQQALRISASDEAAGIAAEDLPRLFQKGYSTKPPASNSGLGLHWCANALRALGGHITVHSDGPGRGARFECQVPLPAAPAQIEERAA